MKIRIAMSILALVAVVALGAADQSETARTMLEAARKMEVVDGDLNGAIKQYRVIVDRFGAERAVAATALVRMAECYEKLGSADARSVYEQVLREYADQKEALALARARLGSNGFGAGTTAMALRKVWTAGPHVEPNGTVSPDGRYVSYTDSTTGDLALHDLVTNTDRRLTNKGTWAQSHEAAFWSVISRDGKQVAYAWFNGKDRYEVRVANLTTVGFPQPRRVIDNEDIQYIAPKDWSPDGTWIAVQLRRKDRTEQIGVVGVQDGLLRVLKSTDWGGATNTKILFSPDGRYVAYDLPDGEPHKPRDVFILAVDGSREVPAVVNPAADRIMGWSPDGKRLLFASDRGGTVGLWALPVANGKPQGAPELIKSNTGWMSSYGISTARQLYFGLVASVSDVHVASVDFNAGTLLTAPSAPVESFVGWNRYPAWSPDGKWLAHISLRGNGVISIRSSETSQEIRVLQPKLLYVRSLNWAPDGRSFVSEATDFKGRNGVYQIDAQTGEATSVAVSSPGGGFFAPQWSLDGRKIYYRSRLNGADRTTYALIERDLASGNERELLRQTGWSHPSLSLDGRHVAVRDDDPSTKSSVVRLIPVAGGESRELIRVRWPHGFGDFVTWAPDGRSVIVYERKGDKGQSGDVLLVPITNGPPTKLQIPGWRGGPMSVHPDGRRIAFTVEKSTHEVWVLENFLPASSASRSSK